jgi:hypothetical protein
MTILCNYRPFELRLAMRVLNDTMGQRDAAGQLGAAFLARRYKFDLILKNKCAHAYVCMYVCMYICALCPKRSLYAAGSYTSTSLVCDPSLPLCFVRPMFFYLRAKPHPDNACPNIAKAMLTTHPAMLTLNVHASTKDG